MTSDNRDSASRLSDALDELFERRLPPPQDDTDPTGLDASRGDAAEEAALVSPVATPEPPRDQVPPPTSPHSLPPESLPPESLPAESLPPESLPPESLPPESLPPESLPPKSLPPKSLPPESLPPESLPPFGEQSISNDAPGSYVLPPIVLATEESPESTPDLAPDFRPALGDEDLVEHPSVPPAAPVVMPPSATATTSPATAWGDHMPVVTAPPAGELRAAGRRPRVRRVTRVIRHVDPWSVFKVGLIFSAVMYVVLLSSGVLLWRVADSTGSLDNVERWFTQFGWETFEFNGDELFRNAWVIGLFGVVAMTGGLVLLATLFNLVSDIVGGVRVTVLEEEVVERTMSNARRYVVRRPVDAVTGGAAVSTWSVDDDEPVGTTSTVGSGSVDTSETGPTAVSVAVPPTTSDWSADD